MGLINGTTNISNANMDNVIDKYLQFSQGKFHWYNKETKLQEEQDLSEIAILDLGYTIKGSVWNNDLQKNTAGFFSNEIREWSQPLYFFKSVYGIETQNVLITKGLWRDIKEIVKGTQGASLNLALTIFDFKTQEVKELFVHGGNFYRVSQSLSANKDLFGNTKFKIVTETKYTDGTKDSNGEENLFTHEEVKKLISEAKGKMPTFQARHRVFLEPLNETFSDDIKEYLLDINDRLDISFEAKQKSYNDRYGESTQGEVFEPEYKQYAKIEQPSEFENFVQENKEEIKKNFEIPKMKKPNDDEISIEDIPF